VRAVGWEIAGMAADTGLDPMVVGIVCSTVAMMVGSLATQASSPVPEAIVRALDETAKLGPIPTSLMLGQDQTLAAQAEIAGRSK
jgi:sodium/proline symporter